MVAGPHVLPKERLNEMLSEEPKSAKNCSVIHCLDMRKKVQNNGRFWMFRSAELSNSVRVKSRRQLPGRWSRQMQPPGRHRFQILRFHSYANNSIATLHYIFMCSSRQLFATDHDKRSVSFWTHFLTLHCVTDLFFLEKLVYKATRNLLKNLGIHYFKGT